MKLNFLHVFSFLALSALMSSCGMPGVGTTNTVTNNTSNTQTSTAGGILGAVLGSILGQNNQISQEQLVGTWKYNGASCKFESENLLKQAGGEFIASSVESKIDDTFSKIGIQKGSSSITFAEDGTCNYAMGDRAIAGTYEFDQTTGKLTVTGTVGLVKTEGYVVKNSDGSISVLYDADKLLNLVNMISAKTSNTSIKTISSLLGSYDGIKVGMNLAK